MIMSELQKTKDKYRAYKATDKKFNRGAPDFTLDEFLNRLSNAKCVYCGTTEKLGLDRIDNSKGHTLENTLPCCELCNRVRGNSFTVKEMKLIGIAIKVVRKLRKGLDKSEKMLILLGMTARLCQKYI